MNDVAKLAEVGRGTVSNYINGQKVKEENRLKIQKAIDELGYVPNLQAKELRTSINTEVVFIVPTNWTPFFSEMIFYMQKHLGRFGYKMILENSHSSPEEEKDILAMIAGTVADQPNEWLAIEVYRNNEAYKQHLETKNFKEYLNNTKYCVESKSLRKLQPDVIVDQGAIFYQP